MTENVDDHEYRKNTVSVLNNVEGYVDIEGPSFGIRLTYRQAKDFAYSILRHAGPSAKGVTP